MVRHHHIQRFFSLTQSGKGLYVPLCGFFLNALLACSVFGHDLEACLFPKNGRDVWCSDLRVGPAVAGIRQSYKVSRYCQ